VLVTGVDAVLLERSKGFFRGGFLSVDYLEGPMQTAAFLAISLLVDAAFIGVVAALVSWLLRWSRLRAAARLAAGVLAGAGVLLAYDAATYQILRFLGDAFDLKLMLDLVGGNLAEIAAVTSAQLLGPSLVAVGGLVAAAAVVAVVHRYAAPANGRVSDPILAPLLLTVAAAVGLGAAATRSDVLENGLLRKPAGQAFAAIVNAVTDVDRDGFGVVGRSSDPDAFDAAVYPYAVDRPGNGLDEDGVAGDLPPSSTPFADAPAPSATWQRRPDVVLVVLESFRADLVGARFQGKPVTPVLDALGKRGYSSPSAYSHNGYTVQSRFHLFSGTLAGRPGAPTLIDDFKARGYQVGYISGQDETFGGPLYDIGFSRADTSSDARSDRDKRYSTSSTPGSLAVPLSVVEGHVTEFLGRADADRPLFLSINFHDTHFPYTHPGIETITSAARIDRAGIVPGARDALWATYANTAANVDRAIGSVIDAVRAARGREPGIVVTSDHGESLFDEGFLGHGYGLNEAQTRVPFVVANLPIEIPEPFGQSELRPALLAALSEPDQARLPRARPRGDAPVFQYLGDLARPRQLAFLGPRGRFIYDFRSRRAKAPAGDWLPPDQLPKGERESFLALVRFWERVQLARYDVWQRANGEG
jgi:glucan phosphoethanolaminetransferase (alkaline phosphatase superfamily)